MRRLGALRLPGRAVTVAAVGAALAALSCANRAFELEPLEVERASPDGRVRVSMWLRTGGREEDAWVVRVRGPGARKTDVVLPSLPSVSGDRSVSRRKPMLRWDRSSERLVVETIRSAFVVVYVPEDAPAFACEHRIINPDDAWESLKRTPSLARLQEEILTEEDKPHDAEEQGWVLGRLERAGATSARAAAVLPGVLYSSDAIDRTRLERLAIARLRPGSGLDPAVRASELGRLRRTVEDLTRHSDREHVRPAIRALGLLATMPAEEGAGPIAAALEAVVARVAIATAAPDVIDAIAPLAWLAGRWRIEAALPALGRFLAIRDEIPHRSRAARNLALWSLVRLGGQDAVPVSLPLLDTPVAWTIGGRAAAVPPDARAEASHAWAEETPFGIVFAWAAARTRDPRAVPALRKVLERRDSPRNAALAAARAWLAIDPEAGRRFIATAPSLDEAARRELVGR